MGVAMAALKDDVTVVPNVELFGNAFPFTAVCCCRFGTGTAGGIKLLILARGAATLGGACFCIAAFTPAMTEGGTVDKKLCNCGGSCLAAWHIIRKRWRNVYMKRGAYRGRLKPVLRGSAFEPPYPEG